MVEYGIATDNKRFNNLYTEENISLLASLLPHQLLYPSKITNNEEKYEFCVNTILNNLDVAMSWVERFSSVTKMGQKKSANNKEDISTCPSSEEPEPTINTNL